MSLLSRLSVPILSLATVAVAVPAAAQTATGTLSANLGGLAKLSLSSTTLTFPDSNPDTVPKVPAAGGAITITAKARGTAGSTITLTMVASDDLRSGLNTIPIAALTWTASGAGFVNGTASSIVPQVVGTWSGSGVVTGTQMFFFQNSWNYSTGTYSVSLLYTLVAP